MQGSLFKDKHFVAIEKLKLNNTNKNVLDKTVHYFTLFFVIKYC